MQRTPILRHGLEPGGGGGGGGGGKEGGEGEGGEGEGEAGKENGVADGAGAMADMDAFMAELRESMGHPVRALVHDRGQRVAGSVASGGHACSSYSACLPPFVASMSVCLRLLSVKGFITARECRVNPRR